MLIKNYLIKKLVPGLRFCSDSTKSKKETLLLQRTTYDTDDWTNISSRFVPFVGSKLWRKQNHPLKLTQEGVVGFFKKWYNDNVDSCGDLPVYDNLDPIEPNTSTTKHPTAFYVNQELMLRTHFIDREIQFLKSGVDNFISIFDLYRRCQMDSKHFPAFHRVNFIRTTNCENLLRQGSQIEEPNALRHMKDEQQAVLVEMAKHLIGTDVKYRWTEANSMATDPSWMFEIWHQNEWHRISGGGIIRKEIFEQSERLNTTGWEIAIGLDRLAMLLYNVFDVRLLWNADQKFLSQFEPKVKKIPQIMKNEEISPPLEKTVSERAVERSTMQSEQTFVPKKNKYQMNISFVLPQNMGLESFPADELCKFIKMHTDGAADEVTL